MAVEGGGRASRSGSEQRPARSRSRSQERRREKETTRSRTGSPSRSRSRSNRTHRRRSRSNSSRTWRRGRRSKSRSRKRSPENENGYRLHVADLNEHCRKKDLEQLFMTYGPLKEIWLATYAPFYAFIVFRHRSDAQDAAEGTDGSTP